MGDVNYSPVILDMVWSFSRVKTFYDCPHRWYLKYLQQLEGEDLFFSNYGSFLHRIIEFYCKKELSEKQLVDYYLENFTSEIKATAPSEKIFDSYFKSGLNYLKNITPFPFNTLEVEKKINFEIDGFSFIGILDYLGEKDGDLYIVDNKSRTLKPRSKRKKPTKTDEELDEYLVQLYLYSAAIEQKYGKLPKELCLNCFRTPVFIRESFSYESFSNAKSWLTSQIEEISKESDFDPDMDFFKCNYLCEMKENCDYYWMNK